MRRTGLLWTMLLLALPLGAQGSSASVDPGSIVTRASRVWAEIKTFRADFKMRVVDKLVGNEDSQGVMSQAGNNRFLMRWTSPAGGFYLIDGTWEYTYYPKLTRDQVQRRPAPSNGSYGTNYLAWIFDSSATRYTLRYLRSENVAGRLADAVDLTPKARDLPFRRVTVWFDREDGIPRKLDFDEVEQHRIIELSRIQKNPALPDSIFKFTKPAGARLVTP